MKGLELWQDSGALVLNDKDIQFVGKKYKVKIDTNGALEKHSFMQKT